MISHSRPTIDKKDLAAVKAVLVSGEIVQGEKVLEFERKMAGFIGLKSGVAISSGTAAIHFSLLSLGIGRGDEVILPSFVCTAPYQAILSTGARPRLVDVEPDSYNLSSRETKKGLNRRTKAVIIPHMFGHPVRIRQFLSLGIPVLEDCAQSLGANLSGKKAGSFGKISIFSFYAAKLITTGEGGMILSNSNPILKKLKNCRDYDRKGIDVLRFNYKMTDFQAALGISQLKKLPHFVKRRRDIAERFNCAFKDSLLLKIPALGSGHIYYRYVLRVQGNIEKFIESLRQKGINAQRPVFKPLHQYLNLTGFPETDKAYQEAISIPIYPSLKEVEIERIIKAVKEVFRG